MGYDMYREGESWADDGDGYFRLNIWGMDEARSHLIPFGVVRLAEMPEPPEAATFGVEESFDFSDEEAQTDGQRAYVEALRQWRDGPHGEAPGIPVYKLGSNDGWLVNPIEVRSGLRWADEHHPGWRDTLPDWCREFVDWMEGASEGFRVH